MLEFNFDYGTLVIDPKNLSEGTVIFEKTLGKKLKGKAKDYLCDFFHGMFVHEDIKFSEGDLDMFYGSLTCESFKTTKTHYIIKYNVTNHFAVRGVMYFICNHFRTVVKDGYKKYFASKKHTFDYFDITEINHGCDGNLSVILESDNFSYVIDKINSKWYLSSVYDRVYCDYDYFSNKLRSLKFDFNRFIVDDKFCFIIDDLNEEYKDFITNLLGKNGDNMYTKSVIAEKLNILDLIINQINREVKNDEV